MYDSFKWTLQEKEHGFIRKTAIHDLVDYFVQSNKRLKTALYVIIPRKRRP